MDWPSINISNLRWWESSCHQLQINAGVGWRHHHDAGRWNFLRLEIDWLTSLLTMVFSEFYATETLKEKLWHLNPTILHIVLHRISSDWLLYASSRKKCIPIMFLYKIKLRFRKIALIRRHRDLTSVPFARSTTPFPSGWCAVVCIFSIWSSLHSSENSMDMKF